MGNHDGKWLKEKDVGKFFEEIEKMNYVVDDGKAIQMCHFPIAEWNRYHRGSYLIYGHIHGDITETYQFMKKSGRALNAAACINHYEPVSFRELIKNNEQFWERNP